MTTEQTRTLGLIADDGQSETAGLIDELFARVEALERDNRTLNRLVSALIERDEQRSPAAIAAAVAKDARLLVSDRPVLAQSGADDPRD